jgi:ATP-dependent Clp protease adapter protein ClpS
MWGDFVHWLARRKYGEVAPPVPRLAQLEADRLPQDEAFAIQVSNDASTPMDLVVYVLREVLSMSHRQAVDFMLKVHTNGSAAVGRLPHQDAQQASACISEFALANGHILTCKVAPFLPQVSQG